MSEQAKPVGASDKMKAKDFITLGIFTVLFFAVVMVCIFASAATVVTFAFGSAIAAIPGGIIYMLMRAKVPKAGSVLLSGVVIGLIEFLIGAGWAVAVGFIAGAVIAELLARIGHYKSFWLNTIGYSVYMMFFALGTYLPMVIMTGYVDDMSTSNGVSAEYLTELHSFMNGTMVVIIAVVTFVAGIVGALIAKACSKSISRRQALSKGNIVVTNSMVSLGYFGQWNRVMEWQAISKVDKMSGEVRDCQPHHFQF